MEKRLINNWNVEKKHLIKYQKVFVNNKNDFINVHINQYADTPGIIINTLFNIKESNYYILEVEGFAKKNTHAFLWIGDIQGNRLTNKDTFLDNELSTIHIEFQHCKNTLTRVGVFVNEPTVYDTFCIKKMNLYECSEYESESSSEEEVCCDVDITCIDTLTYHGSVISEPYCNKNIIYNEASPVKPILKNIDLYYTLFNSSYKYLNEDTKYSNIIPHHKPSSLLLDIRSCIKTNVQLTDFIKMSMSNQFKKNSHIPLGYIFLSQLMTNDITHMPKCQSPIPLLNLSSIYEDRYEHSIFDSNRMFIIDNTMLPDFRNSSHFILHKLHTIFQLLHNRLMEENTTKNINKRFNIVKQEVIYTYQWIIVYDLLDTIIDNDILKCVIEQKPQYYSVLDINEQLPLECVTLLKLVNNLLLPDTIKMNKTDVIPELDLYIYNNETILSPDTNIYWSLFFDMEDGEHLNYSKRINTNIIEDLNYTYNVNTEQLEDDCEDMSYMSIMLQDLVFCQQNELPSGQHISHRLHLNPIDPELMKKYDNNALGNNHMLKHTPFLLYVLKEAEIFKKGKMLTGIGAIIIAEVILTILFEDKHSFLNSTEKWTPSLPSTEDGHLRMTDIIHFINDEY